jgi:CHAD domain-containing protein
VAKAQQLTEIDCDGPVHAAMTLVLSRRVEEMCAFRNAALDWSNPEGVHNMRVASRRLRSALRDFMPYLAKRRVSNYSQKVRDIAQALGRARDYDVEIMELERIAEKAPPDIAGGIRRFAQFRNARREEARVKLIPELNSEFLLELKVQFTKALKPGSRSQTRKSANQTTNVTYREVAGSIILDHLDQLERLSGSLYYPLRTRTL